MYQLPLRFVNVGPDFTLCATRILCVFDPRTTPGKDAYRRARAQDKMYDARGGKAAASLILLDNDYLVASPIKPITIYRRLRSLDDSYIMSTKKIASSVRAKEIAEAAADGIKIYAENEFYEDESDSEADYLLSD